MRKLRIGGKRRIPGNLADGGIDEKVPRRHVMTRDFVVVVTSAFR
jgi:hypothetical protein